jgi:hypothetical protein
MQAFQVFVNGKKVCVAGIGNDGVLSTILTYAPFKRRRETRLRVGGLISPANEHVAWVEAMLRVGDEVRVRVIETETVDKPSKRYPRDPKFADKMEKRNLRILAKKWGWKLVKKTAKRKKTQRSINR